eukprot:CAMPEP_0175165964 /NCGR_PEP_ID=MMETSP0087-20121206/27410_1 /TAXON_ID=136419 /ORGANISM="Unknown Unknown, Strain D1" /LENGTH=154 /DNA_ID=CAMNT_0016455463 /DNA_START=18 /DNA_END=483 /DNA_ORIENTATION=+
MGGESRSNKSRKKRPGLKGLQQRRRQEMMANDKKSASDIRVVKIANKDKKARVVASMKEELIKSATKKSREEKQVRGIMKKIKQIQALKEKEEQGEKLTYEQQKKIGTLVELIASIEQLMGRAFDFVSLAVCYIADNEFSATALEPTNLKPEPK